MVTIVFPIPQEAKRHTIIDKYEYRLRRIIRSYGNAYAYRASLHSKSFALYVTLADWLWQRANHPTFLPVCVRMAAHAQYSVCQSVSLDDYYKVYKIKMCYPHQISTRIACWIVCQPWADRDLALSLGVGPNLRMTFLGKNFDLYVKNFYFTTRNSY